MHRFTPSNLKDLLSTCLLTAGFALISSGVGIICGLGTGLIAGGVSLVALHQWWAKSDG